MWENELFEFFLPHLGCMISQVIIDKVADENENNKYFTMFVQIVKMYFQIISMDLSELSIKILWWQMKLKLSKIKNSRLKIL